MVTKRGKIMKQDKLLVAAMVIVGIILLGCIVAYVA